MQLLGQPVRHNAFGTGVITGLSGNIITIDFAQGEKRFQYPDAFSRFLTLKDAGKQNEIRAGYERRLRAERAERQKELERQERLGKIRSMKVTPYSQAAFDIPWKEAKAAAEADAVSTGFYLSGYSKDRPRIPSRLKPNSACLLTTLETGCEEKERRILGAFMVRDDFWGAYCREGMIKAHDRYKLYLPSGSVPFPVSWTVKMKKKQKETQDILSYHTQAAGCSDKARAKASGGRQPIEECGRTGL